MPESVQLVPADYVDAGRYRNELEQVLARSWLPVCRLDQVPEPGDRFAATLLDRPLVVTRADDLTVRVLANVCPHRGSLVASAGPSHGSNLVCPYHRWAFRSDGSLIGGPHTDGADLDGACLTAMRHVEWRGFVLVDLSGEAPDAHAEWTGLADAIAPWPWDDLVVARSEDFQSTWNWKVMVENWIECYHHVGTHREVLEPLFPAGDTTVIDSAGAPWVAMTVGGVDGVGGGPSGWMPGVDDAHADLLSVWGAFPLLLAGSVADHAFWLQVLPDTVNRHSVRMHLLVHREQRPALSDAHLDEAMATLRHVHLEDMATCAAVQAGLRSGLLDRFRLVDLESPIAAFQAWVAERLGDGGQPASAQSGPV